MRKVWGCTLVMLLAGCQQDGTEPNSKGHDVKADQTNSVVANERPVETLPDTGLTDINDVDVCINVFGAVAMRQGGDIATSAKTVLAIFDNKDAYKRLDEFQKKDRVAELAPKVEEKIAPYKDTHYFSITLDSKASSRREIAMPYDSAGPGFRDGSGYLAGGERLPQEVGGVMVEGTGGRENSTIEMRRMDNTGMRTCNIVFNFNDDWHHWFIVPNEAEARAVESARAKDKLKLRLQGVIKDVRVESNPSINHYAPYIETSVLRVQLVDDKDNVLATPKPTKPQTQGQ
ncbi:hypothetical protein [Pseudoxanthomonas mexicana]